MSAASGKTWKPCEMALDDRCVQEGCFWPSTECFLREVVPAEIVADPGAPISDGAELAARQGTSARSEALIAPSLAEHRPHSATPDIRGFRPRLARHRLPLLAQLPLRPRRQEPIVTELHQPRPTVLPVFG